MLSGHGLFKKQKIDASDDLYDTSTPLKDSKKDLTEKLQNYITKHSQPVGVGQSTPTPIAVSIGMFGGSAMYTGPQMVEGYVLPLPSTKVLRGKPTTKPANLDSNKPAFPAPRIHK